MATSPFISFCRVSTPCWAKKKKKKKTRMPFHHVLLLLLFARPISFNLPMLLLQGRDGRRLDERLVWSIKGGRQLRGSTLSKKRRTHNPLGSHLFLFFLSSPDGWKRNKRRTTTTFVTLSCFLVVVHVTYRRAKGMQWNGSFSHPNSHPDPMHCLSSFIDWYCSARSSRVQRQVGFAAVLRRPWMDR